MYDGRKLTNKPNKRLSSSCSNINNTTEIQNQNVVCPPEQNSGINTENGAPSSSSMEINVNTHVDSECSENATVVVTEHLPQLQQEVEKTFDSNEGFQESPLPESDRLQDNTPNEAVETLQNSEPSEIHLPDPQTIVNSSVPAEGDIVDDIPLNYSDEASIPFVDASSTISLNIENSDEITIIDAETEPPVDVNHHDTSGQLTDPQITTNIDQEQLPEDTDANVVPETLVTVSENSTVGYCNTDSINSEVVTNIEVSAVKESPSSEANESLDLELNLSFKPEVEIDIVIEDTDEALDPLQLHVDENSASNEPSNNQGIFITYLFNNRICSLSTIKWEPVGGLI